MRIVYVLTSLGVGGAERQVLALAARMVERGYAVSLLVLRSRLAEECPTPLDVVHLDMRRNAASVFVGLLKARHVLREARPDLVHSHSFHANMAARLVKLLVPSIAVLSTVHNINEGGWVRMLAYRLTDGLSRRTTAVCDAAASRFVRLKAIPRDKCAVLTNGIDTVEFSPNAGQRASTRDAMGVTGEFIWLAAGRIVAAKDYPTLLRAFALVRASHPQARLWIAAEATGPEFARLKELSVQLGLCSPTLSSNQPWQYLGSAIECLGLRHDIPALLDGADAFVLSSLWEGMPLAVGEAMAMQKPVVATDVGGLRKLVGDAGLLAPPANPKALAEAMVSVMRLPSEDRKALGRAARSRIRSEFSMNAKADEWESLYRTLLQSN